MSPLARNSWASHRPRRMEEAWDALERVVDQRKGGVVISGTDILFEPTLGYRPYEALRRLGRRLPIVATWLGHVEAVTWSAPARSP